MGYNGYGQLGDGTTMPRTSPKPVASNVVAVAAGDNHSVFLRSDGTCWAMGYNGDGELGNGTIVNSPWPVSVVGMSLANIVSGSMAFHTLAVGTFHAPVINNQPVSQTVAPNANVNFTVAAAGAGTLSYQWYFNGSVIPGAAFTNYNINFATTNNVGNYTVVITNLYGCVTSSIAALTVAWVIVQPTNQVPVGGTVNVGVTAFSSAPIGYQWFKDGRMLAGATNSTLSLASAGASNSGAYYVVMTNLYNAGISLPSLITVGEPDLLGWGWNRYGQLGDGTTADQAWPEVVAGNVVTSAAGYGHSLFLKGDSTLWTVGFNSYGELGDGTTTSRTLPELVVDNVVATAAGAYHSLFVKGDGTLWAMGDNNTGQLGDGTMINRHSPISVATNVVMVGAGANHSLFLRSDGTLWAMGFNGDGELGDGTGVTQSSAVAVIGGSNVVALAAGYSHSLFLRSDGTLWAMGLNNFGQLGDGTLTTRSNAVAVIGGTNVVAVAAGRFHSLFLKGDGTLWAMGNNHYGQLGDGTTANQLSPESVASNVVAAAAGYYGSLFLKSDGTLWAMGFNQYGQLGDGTTTSRTLPVSIAGMSLANVISGSVAYHTLAIGSPQAPVITGQPVTQTAVAGDTATFTATATGFAPLSYQWYFNDSIISGATATNCPITSVTTSDAGNYTVVVTNLYGSATSSAALLTVLPLSAAIPTITSATPNADGTVSLGFAGLSNYTYRVEAATNLTQPVWEILSTNLADTNGLWNYTDTNAASYPQRFYRAYKP
jgi:alpha-tubulin suppressor-like RCC1 family protein